MEGQEEKVRAVAQESGWLVKIRAGSANVPPRARKRRHRAGNGAAVCLRYRARVGLPSEGQSGWYRETRLFVLERERRFIFWNLEEGYA